MTKLRASIPPILPAAFNAEALRRLSIFESAAIFKTSPINSLTSQSPINSTAARLISSVSLLINFPRNCSTSNSGRCLSFRAINTSEAGFLSPKRNLTSSSLPRIANVLRRFGAFSRLSSPLLIIARISEMIAFESD